VQIYYAHYGEGKDLNTGRLQILEGYKVKDDVLRNGREQKGEREGSSVLLTFKMETLHRFSAKDLKFMRKRERNIGKERALY